jgi:hypothetical protein
MAERMVSGPSTGLLVSGILNVVFSVLALIGNLAGMGMGAMEGGREGWQSMASGTYGMIWNVVFIAVGALVIFGSQKMKKLENYGLAMASAILTVIPCTTCCLWGIPIGIWAIITLSKSEVKSAFH